MTGKHSERALLASRPNLGGARARPVIPQRHVIQQDILIKSGTEMDVTAGSERSGERPAPATLSRHGPPARPRPRLASSHREGDDERLLVRWRRMTEPSTRLICFPHAGGGASAFSTWSRLLPDTVDLIAVQLPGRETRIREPAPDDLETVIDELTAATAFDDELPCVLFGHSWGAVLAFELSRRHHRDGRPPGHLIVSGAQAPHFALPLPVISHLPRGELIAALARLNGIHPEVLRHDDYLDLVIPTFRTDLRLAEGYGVTPGDALPCPITAFGGDFDPLTSWSTLDGWRRYTSAEFRLTMFPGDHFFTVTAREQVLNSIVAALHDIGTRPRWRPEEKDAVPLAGQPNSSSASSAQSVAERNMSGRVERLGLGH